MPIIIFLVQSKMYGLVLIAVVIILGWFLWRKCDLCPSKCQDEIEGFMPYRCGRTGMNYLDAYYQQDYYKEYPYGYPNPDSYTTAWYTLRNMFDRHRYLPYND